MRIRLLLLMIAGLALLATLSAPPLPAEAGLIPIDRQEEIEFGRAACVKVESRVRLVSGARLARVQRLGAKVAKATGVDLPFTFKVIDEPQINAFTFPGGFIYVCSGLLDQNLGDDALAGVLGHECAHAVKSHSFKILKPLALIGQTTKRIPRMVKDNIVSKLVTLVTVEGMGRRFELEADALGAEYEYHEGYDPQGLIQVFELFERLRTTQPSIMQRMLASHPDPAVRIKKLRPVIAKLKAGG